MGKLLVDASPPIAFHREFARVFGINGALFIQQIYYWSDKGSRSDGYIYKTKIEIENETCLTIRQQDKIVKELKELGCLDVKLLKANGNPTLHYKLNIEKIQKVVFDYNKMYDSNHTLSNIPITENTTENTTEKERKKERENFQEKIDQNKQRFLNDNDVIKKLSDKGYSQELINDFLEFWNIRRIRDKTSATVKAIDIILDKFDNEEELQEAINKSIEGGYRNIYNINKRKEKVIGLKEKDENIVDSIIGYIDENYGKEDWDKKIKEICIKFNLTREDILYIIDQFKGSKKDQIKLILL